MNYNKALQKCCKRKTISKILVIGGNQQYLYLRIVQTQVTIYNFKICELQIWNQICELLKKARVTYKKGPVKVQ